MNRPVLPFVRFINFLKAVEANSTESRLHSENYAILCHIHAEVSNQKVVTVTSLVQSLRFGTLPTVTRRIKELESLNLIFFTETSDKRSKALKLTKKAVVLLRWLSSKMQVSLAQRDIA